MSTSGDFATSAQQIRSALDSIRSITMNRDADCFIVADTGFDEATIVGSPAALLGLTEILLEGVLRSIGAQLDWLRFEWQSAPEHGAVFSNDIKHSFDELADVWPVCLLVTTDNVLAREFAMQNR